MKINQTSYYIPYQTEAHYILDQIKDLKYHEEDEYNNENNNYEDNQKEINQVKIIDKKTKSCTNEEKKNHDDLYINPLKELLNEKIQFEPNYVGLENEKPTELQKKRGRKKEKSEQLAVHNKFSDDNLRRKCKHILMKNLMIFINKKIYDLYEGKIGSGLMKKELQTLNQKQKYDATITFNKQFIYKTIGEIFSEDVSKRFTNFPLDHNKKLIEKLTQEKDEKKKKFFSNLFDLTFIDCMKHFTGEKYIDELKGFDGFEQVMEDLKKKYKEDGEDYVESLKYYLNNYEYIIINKRKRRPRKLNQEIIND